MSASEAQTKQDISFGVIPARKAGKVWQVLLIHQFTHSGDAYWTFPKGHPEANESEEETARRELKEETGVTTVKLYPKHRYTNQYTFRHGEHLIEKTVVYFLGVVGGGDLKINQTEIDEAGWYPLEVARKKLSHDIAKNILDSATNDLADLA